jgi:hypothetical protein
VLGLNFIKVVRFFKSEEKCDFRHFGNGEGRNELSTLQSVGFNISFGDGSVGNNMTYQDKGVIRINN